MVLVHVCRDGIGPAVSDYSHRWIRLIKRDVLPVRWIGDHNDDGKIHELRCFYVGLNDCVGVKLNRYRPV